MKIIAALIIGIALGWFIGERSEPTLLPLPAANEEFLPSTKPTALSGLKAFAVNVPEFVTSPAPEPAEHDASSQKLSSFLMSGMEQSVFAEHGDFCAALLLNQFLVLAAGDDSQQRSMANAVEQTVCEANLTIAAHSQLTALVAASPQLQTPTSKHCLQEYNPNDL